MSAHARRPHGHGAADRGVPGAAEVVREGNRVERNEGIEGRGCRVMCDGPHGRESASYLAFAFNTYTFPRQPTTISPLPSPSTSAMMPSMTVPPVHRTSPFPAASVPMQ